MTQIIFFHGAHDRLQAIAQWLIRANSEGQRVVVYAPSDEQSQQLSRLLWMQPATGFMPHCHASDRLEPETPVVIASGSFTKANTEVA